MWRRIVRDLKRYPTAVVTVLDDGGHPVSVRCRPVPDSTRQVLRVELPPWLCPRPGPAGLLCHAHNDRLWALRSFGVRGVLERRDGHWVLVPHRHVPGVGKGALGFLRLARSGRRTAAAYLRLRGLPRPAIPWQQYEAMRKRFENDATVGTPAVTLPGRSGGTKATDVGPQTGR